MVMSIAKYENDRLWSTQSIYRRKSIGSNVFHVLHMEPQLLSGVIDRFRYISYAYIRTCKTLYRTLAKQSK